MGSIRYKFRGMCIRLYIEMENTLIEMQEAINMLHEELRAKLAERKARHGR